jgi:hypothetical protein
MTLGVVMVLTGFLLLLVGFDPGAGSHVVILFLRAMEFVCIGLLLLGHNWPTKHHETGRALRLARSRAGCSGKGRSHSWFEDLQPAFIARLTIFFVGAAGQWYFIAFVIRFTQFNLQPLPYLRVVSAIAGVTLPFTMQLGAWLAWSLVPEVRKWQDDKPYEPRSGAPRIRPDPRATRRLYPPRLV